jgi:hypothetical protein
MIARRQAERHNTRTVRKPDRPSSPLSSDRWPAEATLTYEPCRQSTDWRPTATVPYRNLHCPWPSRRRTSEWAYPVESCFPHLRRAAEQSRRTARGASSDRCSRTVHLAPRVTR